MLIVFGIIAAVVVLFVICEAIYSRGTLKTEPDVLLILGCRVRGTQAEETLMMRIEKAADFLKKNRNTLAVACGGIVHKDQYKSEAQVIFEELTARGIDGSRIMIEDKSRTTAQNFINAKKLVNMSDGRSVSFLSSEFHLMRAGMIARSVGVRCRSVAAPSPKKERFKNYLREFWAIPLILTDIKRR